MTSSLHLPPRARTDTRHCLHLSSDNQKRYCCWCTLDQHVVYADKAPLHGPRFPGQRFDFHWEPSSQTTCPNDA